MELALIWWYIKQTIDLNGHRRQQISGQSGFSWQTTESFPTRALHTLKLNYAKWRYFIVGQLYLEHDLTDALVNQN